MMGVEIYCKFCTVDSVDERARTVDCTPLDESAPLVGVNLQANQEGDTGVVCFPAVGSYVIVAFISPAVAAVVLCDKIDKAQLSIGKTQITVDAEVVDVSPRRHLLPNHSRGGAVQRREARGTAENRTAHGEVQRADPGFQHPYAHDTRRRGSRHRNRSGAVEPRPGHGSGRHSGHARGQGFGLRGREGKTLRRCEE